MFYCLFFLPLIFLGFASYIKTKNITNPLFCYIIFWGLFIFLSFFNPFDLYIVSQKTYLFVLLNIICFSLGFILVARKCNVVNIDMSKAMQINKTIVIVQLLLFIVLLYYLIKYNVLMSSSIIIEARKIRFELGYLFNSYAEYIIYGYFVSSILLILLIINVTKYIVCDKLDFSFIVTFVNVYLYSQIGLGRFIFFDGIIFFLLGIFLYKINISVTNNDISFKDKKYIRNYRKIIYILLVIILLLLMVYITSSRTGGKILNITDLFFWINFSFKQGLTYFIGPFRSLDYFLNSEYILELRYLYGRATLAGLDELVNNYSILMGLSFNSANSIMATFTVDPIIIGFDGQYFNAFYTGLMNFYLDGGVVFIVMIPFIYGIIIAKVWNVFNANPNLYTLSLLVFLVKTSFAYLYKWDFSAPSYWIILTMFLILIYFNKRHSIHYES